jgi:N5-(cytidine 5'-diphosphoramidyl)-L-glutamine hydrolase
MSDQKSLKIGISMRIINAANYDEERDALSHDWINFFEDLKIIPILIPNSLKNSKTFLEEINVDGIILSGGDNLGDFPERDKTELDLINYAISSGIPILGVCRGMQIINHFFGGMTIKNNFDTHLCKPHKINLNHISLTSLPNQIEVNSFHNNIILEKNLGNELQPFATSLDGTIEGLIHKKFCILGIMWHPERDPNSNNQLFLKNIFINQSFWKI